MNIAADFRAHAARERAAASKESLANRRAMHERSAMQWDEMAQKVEEHDRLVIQNAAEKAQREKSIA